MPVPHVPTDENRETVAVLVAAGTPLDVIARVLKMERKTLSKHYADEIASGKEIANGKVAQTLFSMATSGRVPAATMFWLKCQAGWREVQRLEHSGPDGSPIQYEALSDAELVERAKGLLDGTGQKVRD